MLMNIYTYQNKMKKYLNKFTVLKFIVTYKLKGNEWDYK